MTRMLCSAAAGLILVSAGFYAGAADANSNPPAAGATSHFAKFGTNRVHYIVQGKGKHTVVLVHCWAGNLGFWREQVLALADKARLVLIDLPGHGESDKPQTSYTMDFFAQAVLAVMRDAKVSKATIVGHSMGVPIICRLYTQAPERVSALVGVDGTFRRPKMNPEQAEQFMARFRSPDYREKAREFLATMFPVPGTEAVRDRVITELLQTPHYVMVSAMEGMFGPDQPDWDIHHANIPVLTINANNPMWTDEYKNYLHSLSDKTEYRNLAGTGHWLMLEKPAEFNGVLVELLCQYDLIDK